MERTYTASRSMVGGLMLALALGLAACGDDDPLSAKGCESGADDTLEVTFVVNSGI